MTQIFTSDNDILFSEHDKSFILNDIFWLNTRLTAVSPLTVSNVVKIISLQNAPNYHWILQSAL
jgi:hypothetical protein